MDWIDKYEEAIFNFVDKYEKVINAFSNYFERLIFIIVNIIQITIFKIIDGISLTRKLFRYATYPLHLIYLKILFNKEKEETILDLPIFELGGHYMYGKPGWGKSTVTYKASLDYAFKFGKAAYTTEMMEEPRTDIYGIEYYYHMLFEPSDFFSGGEQIHGFESDKFNMIVYEEMLTKYHQRNNAKSEFKDEVLPMIAAMGTQRHQGIDLFYFISQLPHNDISLMQMLVGYHIPRVKKGFDYKYWLNTGRIKFVIKGWRMTSYDIEVGGPKGWEKTNKRRWFYKNDMPEEMQYFKRFNMKDKFNKLEKYKGREMPA